MEGKSTLSPTFSPTERVSSQSDMRSNQATLSALANKSDRIVAIFTIREVLARWYEHVTITETSD
jgi:hypothetical protein